jgi:tRNA pseudouridine55 synthase
MDKYFTLEKSIGETPLSAMERVRETRPALLGVPLAYAGRLDPMASGMVLVLVGDECKRQKEYHGLDKEYEFEILLGFESDTGDVLGIAEKEDKIIGTRYLFTNQDIAHATRKLLGTHTLPYPHYSSKTVQGKPLFLWTLENRLDEITIPTMNATVHSIAVVDVRTEPVQTIITHILEKIELIPPVTEESKALGRDFRRADIRTRWNELASLSPKDHVATIVKLRAVVSSGTYIRSLAPLIAHELGMRGLAYSIHRTTIGRFVHWGPLQWWRKRYR